MALHKSWRLFLGASDSQLILVLIPLWPPRVPSRVRHLCRLPSSFLFSRLKLTSSSLTKPPAGPALRSWSPLAHLYLSLALTGTGERLKSLERSTKSISDLCPPTGRLFASVKCKHTIRRKTCEPGGGAISRRRSAMASSVICFFLCGAFHDARSSYSHGRSRSPAVVCQSVNSWDYHLSSRKRRYLSENCSGIGCWKLRWDDKQISCPS